MKKDKTALAEPVTQEVKVIETIYYHEFRGDKWPIRIKFATKKVINNEPSFIHINGFYELMEVSGNSQAVDHFRSSILSSRVDRAILEEFLEKQVQEQMIKDI
jgi:hypothetical protein